MADHRPQVWHINPPTVLDRHSMVGVPGQKSAFWGVWKIFNFGSDAGATHQVPNQTKHIFGILRPISISWQSFSCGPRPPIFGEEKALTYRLYVYVLYVPFEIIHLSARIPPQAHPRISPITNILAKRQIINHFKKIKAISLCHARNLLLHGCFNF